MSQPDPDETATELRQTEPQKWSGSVRVSVTAPAPTPSGTPDVSDPAVRAMVTGNHRPHEVWETRKTYLGYDSLGAELLGVLCGTCRYDWPCPTVQALRQWQAAHPGKDWWDH